MTEVFCNSEVESNLFGVSVNISGLKARFANGEVDAGVEIAVTSWLRLDNDNVEEAADDRFSSKSAKPSFINS